MTHLDASIIVAQRVPPLVHTTPTWASTARGWSGRGALYIIRRVVIIQLMYLTSLHASGKELMFGGHVC